MTVFVLSYLRPWQAVIEHESEDEGSLIKTISLAATVLYILFLYIFC